MDNKRLSLHYQTSEFLFYGVLEVYPEQFLYLAFQKLGSLDKMISGNIYQINNLSLIFLECITDKIYKSMQLVFLDLSWFNGKEYDPILFDHVHICNTDIFENIVFENKRLSEVEMSKFFIFCNNYNDNIMQQYNKITDVGNNKVIHIQSNNTDIETIAEPDDKENEDYIHPPRQLRSMDPKKSLSSIPNSPEMLPIKVTKPKRKYRDKNIYNDGCNKRKKNKFQVIDLDNDLELDDEEINKNKRGSKKYIEQQAQLRMKTLTPAKLPIQHQPIIQQQSAEQQIQLRVLEK